jgi:hypothetical protein
MSRLPVEDAKPKALLKTAIVEALEERQDLLQFKKDRLLTEIRRLR